MLLNSFTFQYKWIFSCILFWYALIHYLLCLKSRIFSCRLLCSTCTFFFASTPGFFLAFCFEARWCSFSLALNVGFCLANFFSTHSFANTPGFFLTFCFEAFWCSFSLALNAGFCLAIFFSAHSFANTPGFFQAIALAVHSFSSTAGFFLAFCFEERWCSFSLALNAGFCLANFFFSTFLC